MHVCMYVCDECSPRVLILSVFYVRMLVCFSLFSLRGHNEWYEYERVRTYLFLLFFFKSMGTWERLESAVP